MKRPRPYIPLSTRLLVAMRQVHAASLSDRITYLFDWRGMSDGQRLKSILTFLFAKPPHLDHDPPLRSRAFNARTGKYTPGANDPRYLVYREAEDHRVKTFVRGERGQYSDTILIARERKREKKKAGKRRKYHWPKRKIGRRHAAVRALHR